MSFKWPIFFNKKTQRAYITFHDDYTYFLTAWNNTFHGLGHWSGLGGKREPFDKDIRYTAIRELIEELFSWKYDHDQRVFINPISKRKIRAKQIFDLCLDEINFSKHNKLDIRVFYVTIRELNKVLRYLSRMVSEANMDSPLYNYFPRNVEELIDDRKPHIKRTSFKRVGKTHQRDIEITRNIKPEIGKIEILSLSSLNRKHNIDQNFKNDIQYLQNIYTK